MKTYGVPEEQHYDFIQIIDKSEREGPEKMRERLSKITSNVADNFAGFVSATLDFSNDQVKSERLDTVEAGLCARGLGDYVKRDYTVVRGLAYYTGVVFEVFDRSGEFRAIAGGGRYDTLLKNLGNVDLPALGFGMGDVVLGEILKAKQFPAANKNSVGVYVVIAEEAFRPQAMKVVQDLRQRSGLSVNYSLVSAKVGKQFQSAEELGCTFAVVVDAKISEGTVEIKDLENRQQHTHPSDHLSTAILRLYWAKGKGPGWTSYSPSAEGETDPSTGSG
jgi:histidyl-tRNA synthetase